jgi:Protein of unknown function (DUF4238)
VPTPPDPRRHHHATRSYLKGFTKSQANNGKLCVYDVERDKVYETSPRNVAVQTDYNRIADPPAGRGQFEAEHVLSVVERQGIDVIRDIEASNALPTSPVDAHALFMFLGLLMMQAPQSRASFARFLVREEQARSTPEEPPRTLTRDALIVTSIAGIPEVAEALMPRHWSLVTTDDEHPLVVTDSPISLEWVRGADQPGGIRLADTRTVITVPLTRRVGLVGIYQRGLPATLGLAGALLLNFHSLRGASRFVASSNGACAHEGLNGKRGTFEDYRAFNRAQIRCRHTAGNQERD